MIEHQIWLDGFTSGAATALVNMGWPEIMADEAAQGLAAAMGAQGRSMVVQQVAERMAGEDSGPVTRRIGLE